MPQYPLVPRFGGDKSKLVIATKTVIKATPGTCWTISYYTNPSTAGTVFDASTTAAATSGTAIANLGTAGGVTSLQWPCSNGIVVDPGTGGVVSVAYD